ncbi:MAG: ATP-binding protein [Acidimicrobiaceae bacterium]|nr:ATP-binding protein [Acidimicrobiaceae bacterium]MDE0499727.1 ATP-binding protein [Acidimicrobiaceae bacterium]
MDYVRRHIEPMLDESLRAFRVVVLHGARQSGKTTLARQLAQRRGGTYVTLDDDATRLAAIDDPVAYLSGLQAPAVVDEVQLGGDRVVRAVKRLVDDSDVRGRFLLTGSTNFLSVPAISESLAGRARILRLFPFTQAEIDGRAAIDLAGWFDDCEINAPHETDDRAQYMGRLCRGGFPEAASLTPEQRQGWYGSYLETVIQRDITELGDIRRAEALVDLVRWLAANTAAELNAEAACRQLGIDRSTFNHYFAWLRTVFMINSVPAWSRKHAARAVRRPKSHFADTGMAAALLGVNAEALASPASTIAGPLLESFVTNELARHTAESAGARIHHLRDYDSHEVDIVLERADGTVAAIEVKATGSPSENHLKPLRWLRDRLDRTAPGLFRIGVLLHTGPHCHRVGDRLWLAPINALWHSQPQIR